jgi:RNA polymerase sigma factor (sigma-70 family)
MPTNTKELVISNLSLANKIARKSQFKYKKFTFDELQSAAYMGLVEASCKYDNSMGVKFTTYAISKMKYAIIDYVAEVSFRKKGKEKFVDLHEIEITDGLTDTDREEFICILTQGLTGKEKEIFICYYLNEKKLHEIASLYELNESRISQILKKVTSYIQEKWRDRERELYEIAA